MVSREEYRCEIQRDSGGLVAAVEVSRSDLESGTRVTRVNGSVVPFVANHIHDILRQHGVSGRAWTGNAAFDLPQVAGAQTELLLRAVKPLRRPDRIEEIASGVAAMGREEASYWSAKAEGPRGLRVLRLLLSDDHRRRG